ncbi:MAG TPA: hypothetical protein VEC36_00405 [Patescibacteria group bacterium]|nr:hypothetical protein [Patescibacteria group bacterium]
MSIGGSVFWYYIISIWLLIGQILLNQKLIFGHFMYLFSKNHAVKKPFSAKKTMQELIELVKIEKAPGTSL